MASRGADSAEASVDDLLDRFVGWAQGSI